MVTIPGKKKTVYIAISLKANFLEEMEGLKLADNIFLSLKFFIHLCFCIFPETILNTSYEIIKTENREFSIFRIANRKLQFKQIKSNYSQFHTNIFIFSNLQYCI